MSTDRDVWAVLGLVTPTGGTRHNTKTIKRAYAKALKAIDQSSDPAGFQTLRQCYERALELSKATTVEKQWRRFALDIGSSPSEIVRIDEFIEEEGTAVYSESQIALDALGDMERVAVLDQSAESADACMVLNALLARSGAVAVSNEALAAIEKNAETIWDNPIGVIETPVEYVAARFSTIATEQKLALLAIHDEGENHLFAIATQDAGQDWMGEKLDVSIYRVDALPDESGNVQNQPNDRPDNFSNSDAILAESSTLFHGDRASPTADAGMQYATYVRKVEVAMAAGSDEEAWIHLLDSLEHETPEMRDDVESMIFRALLETQRSSDGKERLPSSVTENVIDALDEQFQWLSDGVGLQRKFHQDSDIIVIALNDVLGRETNFSKILQKPNWLVVSLLCVLLYAIMRALFDWLTTIGVVS